MVYTARLSTGTGKAAWGLLAVLAGLAAGLLPLPAAGAVLGLAVIGLAVLVEPSLAVALMLGVAPLKTLIETEAAPGPPLDVGQIAFAGTVAVWAIDRALDRGRRSLPRTWLFVPLAVIMLGFAPSLFVARSAGAWSSEMLKWVEMALLVAVVLDLGRRGRWRWIAFSAVLAAAIQGAIGLYEYQGGSGAPHLWIAGYQHFRAFGTFGQPNPYSAYMGLSLPLALGLGWGTAQQAYSVWRTPAIRGGAGSLAALAAVYAALAVLILAGLIVSWGRGAWLGFGAAAGAMVFFAPRKRWQAAALLAVVGLAAAALWLTGLVPPGIQARVDNALDEFTGFGDMRGMPVSDENFAIVERLAHWQAALNMAREHPWLGVGLGSYESAYPDYGIPSWPRALGHAHNDYLNLLAETGIVGLGLYVTGWALVFGRTVRALRQNDPIRRGLVLGLVGVWTHLAVHSFVDKLYVNNLFLHLGVMLGLLAVAMSYTPVSKGAQLVIKDHPGEG